MRKKIKIKSLKKSNGKKQIQNQSKCNLKQIRWTARRDFTSKAVASDLSILLFKSSYQFLVPLSDEGNKPEEKTSTFNFSMCAAKASSLCFHVVTWASVIESLSNIQHLTLWIPAHIRTPAPGLETSRILSENRSWLLSQNGKETSKPNSLHS